MTSRSALVIVTTSLFLIIFYSLTSEGLGFEIESDKVIYNPSIDERAIITIKINSIITSWDMPESKLFIILTDPPGNENALLMEKIDNRILVGIYSFNNPIDGTYTITIPYAGIFLDTTSSKSFIVCHDNSGLPLCNSQLVCYS